MVLRVGDRIPDFTLPSHLGDDVSSYDLRGRSAVLAFFPLAWTPIWTNQIPSYQANLDRFAGLNAQVLGISIDHVPCLKAWAESLGGVSFPLLSDFWPHGELATQFGVLREDGTTERAIFIVDPEGIIHYVDVHNIDDQPDNEVLFAELERLLPPDAVKAARANRPSEADLPSGGVVMYCTPWCHDCTAAKEWLRARQIPFREVNISLSSAGAERVRKWANGDLVTPTFDIDGTIVVDFDEKRLAEVLNVA